MPTPHGDNVPGIEIIVAERASMSLGGSPFREELANLPVDPPPRRNEVPPGIACNSCVIMHGCSGNVLERRRSIRPAFRAESLVFRWFWINRDQPGTGPALTGNPRDNGTRCWAEGRGERRGFRARRSGEDDGYVLSVVYDGEAGTSHVRIIDAQDFAAPPVAKIHLPQRVPFGFHGNWIPILLDNNFRSP